MQRNYIISGEKKEIVITKRIPIESDITRQFHQVRMDIRRKKRIARSKNGYICLFEKELKTLQWLSCLYFNKLRLRHLLDVRTKHYLSYWDPIGKIIAICVSLSLQV